MHRLTVIILAMSVASCQFSAKRAQEIVDKAIQAHGQHKLDQVKVSFDFRGRNYSAVRSENSFTYTRLFVDSLELIEDMLVNSSEFIRLVNGDTTYVPDSMAVKYSNSVNSVLYFVQLPYMLNDAAVVKSYEGSETIAHTKYDVVSVKFEVEGGGEDYSDEFRYWFNSETSLLDYLAYNYETDGGGVRFREAYNRAERMGILFQDYINYEVPLKTPLKEIPALFEQNQLKELSRINNEKITVTKKN